MRAFSTIEILIALAILTAAITAAALVGFGTPFMLANMKLEAIALYAEDADLSRIEHQSWTRLQAIRSVASTTVDGFERSRTIEEIQDDSSLQAESTVSWTDVYGTKRSSTLETVLTSSTDDNPCDPFVSSSWTTPQARSYPLSVGGLLPNTITNDSYPISDLHAVESTLIASIRATTLIASPTLFFFDVSNTTNTPLLIGNGFDNASTSRTGFTSLSGGDGYVYAANGFGSASPQTCADGISCAQVQIFSLPDHFSPRLVRSISLATSSPPFARTIDGGTAPANTITYSKGFLYLGLQKTNTGYEFTIIDVHDPLHPRFVAGIPIGRSVNQIEIHDDFAYVATDDNTRELMVIDVHDPTHPVVAGIWDAPGSTGFGFGTAMRWLGSQIVFGRSYVSNAPELVALNFQDIAHIREADQKDIGTLLRPDSIRRLLPQSFLTFVLTSKKLQFWSTSQTGTLSEFAPEFSFPSGSSGTSLTCRENTLYVGLEQAAATGVLEVITNP